ncbi:MAG: ubiquinol-cytochrome c reductase cytochrome c subunit [Actinomycetota bacterium]|nr:ubiquinol-cytochrome c reductase cytochrome c subunit [Actinomycetota bacterium]
MARRAVAIVAAFALGLLGVILAGALEAAHAQAPSPESSEGGRVTFLRDCAYCHGADAAGTDRGPDLRDVGPASVDFMLSTGRMPVAYQTDDPERQPPEYDRGEIDAIVAYVTTLQTGGPGIPSFDLAAANLAEGNTLYTENCAACHSSAGIGAALTSGRVAPSLKSATPVEIAEAIRTGPGTMPVFATDTLSDEQMTAIVRYVVDIQHPENRGGADLGAIGPITEGLVAAALGLLVLILITRAIGSSADE